MIDAVKAYQDKIYMPEDDMNLLLWSVIPFACFYKLYVDKGIDSDAFSVKRKDGGDFIALATLETDFK